MSNQKLFQECVSATQLREAISFNSLKAIKQFKELEAIFDNSINFYALYVVIQLATNYMDRH